MSEDNTVTMGGIDFDVDDLEAALDEAAAEDGTVDNRDGGYALVGSVAICGDNFNDRDCNVINVSDLESFGGGEYTLTSEGEKYWTSSSRIRSAIEDARDTFDPVEYVAELVADCNTVVPSDAFDAAHTNGDVAVQYGHMGSSEMEKLANDDAISFAKVGRTDDGVAVNVDVDEDVAAE
jgi:hypothetical protein